MSDMVGWTDNVVNEMSTRIDNLENAVQDLMHDDIAGTPIISPPFKR